jgi:prephenate dehydrogenase
MVQQARDFVQHNRDKILDIIETQLRALDELAQWADQQQWSAPWRSYTRYGSIKLEIERNREYFERYR